MPKPARSGKTTRAPWLIHFFQRHRSDDPAQDVPAKRFLDSLTDRLQGQFFAIVKAVADAPPPAFSGGGYWEVMHGDMAGWYEVRVDGPDRRHYRLFCLLERDGAALGLGGPSIVLICGKEKPFRTVLSKQEYAEVKALGDEFRRRTPRSVAR